MATVDSIESSGFPLGFKLRQGSTRSPLVSAATGRDVFRVEARQLAGQQKEAVVTEGVAAALGGPEPSQRAANGADRKSVV